MPNRNENRLIKKFGKNDFGFAELPKKYSGIKISRIFFGDEMGCSYCFPHRHDTINSHYHNRQRCWKKYRKTQYKRIVI